MNTRGMLTQEVETIALSKLGQNITQEELRLMPYIDYILKNSQSLDTEKMQHNEMYIFGTWIARGWVKRGYCKGGRPMLSADGEDFSVTKKFYMAMQEILWVGYIKANKGANNGD